MEKIKLNFSTIRFIVLLVFLITLCVSSFGQKINYTIPKGYESDIGTEEYKKLVDIAVLVVAKRYAIDIVNDGAIQLKKGQEMQTLNLHNLIGKCVAVKDKSAWDAIIREHFENLFVSIDEQKKIDPNNFETVKKYLSIRIYPKQLVTERGGVTKLISRIDLDDTYTLLMLDLPGAFTAVQKEMFELWRKDIHEVFRIAQENVNKQEIEKQTRNFDFDGTNVEVIFLGNENYAASYALDLINNSPELVGDWGSVVAIPNKGLVNICKISKSKPLDFVKFIQRTSLLVDKYYQQHEQPVSNQYFWYYRGIFTKINVLTSADGNINVISPSGLTELMTEKNNP